MGNVRDIFYISANFEESYFIYYGMEFHEFVKHCSIPLKNILVTDGFGVANHYNRDWCLETANGKDDILELAKEDIYGLGNFHWVDYDNQEHLNNSTPKEKAEVLYLSHFGTPLKTPFIQSLHNNFFYLAHDDGWFCKLYCKDMNAFKDIIGNKIVACLSADKRRHIAPMSEEIPKLLLDLTKKGLLIDFSTIRKESNGLSLNFYATCHYLDMDEMYRNIQKDKQNAEIKGTIRHMKGTWYINFYEA